jgi:DNA processing protein
MNVETTVLKLALAIGPGRNVPPSEWNQDLQGWFQTAWPQQSWPRYQTHSQLFMALEKEIALARSLGAEPLFIDERRYPNSLLQLARPPAVLFYRGQLDTLCQHGVAVVGSRAATKAVLAASRASGAKLAALGVTTVSGGAIGVDTAAHLGALEAGGRTIAVFGSGLGCPYPARNRRLFERITAEQGLLLSPFLPSDPPKRWHFPHRNRLIAALARQMIVAAASPKSGALSSARRAHALGRPIAAFRHGAGALSLIARGCRALQSADDIASWLSNAPSNHPKVPPTPSPLDGPQRVVLEALRRHGASAPGTLAHKTALSLSDILAALTLLELSGLVFADGGRYRAVEQQ